MLLNAGILSGAGGDGVLLTVITFVNSDITLTTAVTIPIVFTNTVLSNFNDAGIMPISFVNTNATGLIDA